MASAEAGKHTILLVQYDAKPTSRTFYDFESVQSAVAFVIGLYEKRLVELNPAVRVINYDVSDLYTYMDTFADISALVVDPASAKYDPFPKSWIKRQVYNHLRAQQTGK